MNFIAIMCALWLVISPLQEAYLCHREVFPRRVCPREKLGYSVHEKWYNWQPFYKPFLNIAGTMPLHYKGSGKFVCMYIIHMVYTVIALWYTNTQSKENTPILSAMYLKKAYSWYITLLCLCTEVIHLCWSLNPIVFAYWCPY